MDLGNYSIRYNGYSYSAIMIIQTSINWTFDYPNMAQRHIPLFVCTSILVIRTFAYTNTFTRFQRVRIMEVTLNSVISEFNITGVDCISEHTECFIIDVLFHSDIILPHFDDIHLNSMYCEFRFNIMFL